MGFMKSNHVLGINNINLNCDKLDIIINSIAMPEATKSKLTEKLFLIEKQMAPGLLNLLVFYQIYLTLLVTLTKVLAN